MSQENVSPDRRAQVEAALAALNTRTSTRSRICRSIPGRSSAAVISILAIVGGAVLAVLDAPTWIYPIALLGFLFGLRAYLRRDA